MNDIPNLLGLKKAIIKKQSETEFLDDLRKVPEVYVQDVYQPHSVNNIPQSGTVVNAQSMQGGEDYSRMATAPMGEAQVVERALQLTAEGI